MSDLALSPDGTLLALALGQTESDEFFSESITVSIWDVNSGRRLAELQERGRQIIKGLAFSPDSTTLAIRMRNEESAADTIRLWRAADPRRLQTLAQFKGEASGPVFSADGRTVTILDRSLATTWDVQRRAKLDSWPVPLKIPRRNIPVVLARLPDDNTFVAVLRDAFSSVVVFDLTRREVRSWSNLDEVYSLVTSPLAGEALAVLALSKLQQHSLILLDPFNDRRFRIVDEGSSFFSSLAFSPDGKYILHIQEGIVTLWGVRSP